MKFPRYLIVCMCILGSTLLLFAACSSQTNIVNPSPGTWKIVHSVNPGSAKNALNAVAATSVNDAWAVGAFSNSHFNVPGGKALIEHWNGSAWSVVASPDAPMDGNILTGVTAISPTNAWAVGNAFSDINFNSNNGKELTLIEHWNGTSWTIVESPDPASEAQLFAITALSATDIWVVGGYGNHLRRTFIEHWNGTAWKVVQSPNPGSVVNYLTGLAAISTNDIWATGVSFNAIPSSEMQGTLIEHWNGTSWTVVPNPNPGTNGNTLSAIAAISTNNVWTVGNTNNGSPVTDTLIEHWNGKSWRTVKGQNPGKESNNLSAIVARSQRRTEQGPPAFQQRSALRAGIEGTLSEGVRSHGLRRARYRGKPKTQLQAQAIAAAINLVRIRHMLQRTQPGLSPRPKRPLSSFARLRSRLAA